MIFWESCEAERMAYGNLAIVSKAAEPYLNKEFDGSSLNDLHITLSYIPIVMPEQGRKNYPERSRAKIKQSVYLCAPQLDYPTFVNGSLDAQCIEYMRGIALTSPHLKKFGATLEQIADFDAVIAVAPQQLYRAIKIAQAEK
jgi:hypothetical protein